MPVATAIVPTHSHASTLPRSVRSALSQTERDIEVIVVGDGVDEPTPEAAQALVEADDRVRFVDNPKGGPRVRASAPGGRGGQLEPRLLAGGRRRVVPGPRRAPRRAARAGASGDLGGGFRVAGRKCGGQALRPRTAEVPRSAGRREGLPADGDARAPAQGLSQAAPRLAGRVRGHGLQRRVDAVRTGAQTRDSVATRADCTSPRKRLSG